MNAIHISHSAPFYARESNKGQMFTIRDFELLTTILSALKWREINGDIRLYCDSIAYEYYKSQNMLFLWNLGIDTNVLDNIEENINFEVFWAAGKIYALMYEATPCIMMDTDFVAWTDVSRLIKDYNSTVCIHREEISQETYLPPELLKTSPNYNFLPNLDWEEKPCNTAFVYFGDDSLKRFFVEESIRFMDNNLEKPQELVSQMVFAEQRLLAMCAKIKDKKIESFVELDNLFCQESFTHIWGYKKDLAADYVAENLFCTKIVDRLLNDFKDLSNLLLNIPVVRKYM